MELVVLNTALLLPPRQTAMLQILQMAVGLFSLTSYKDFYTADSLATEMLMLLLAALVLLAHLWPAANCPAFMTADIIANL